MITLIGIIMGLIGLLWRAWDTRATTPGWMLLASLILLLIGEWLL